MRAEPNRRRKTSSSCLARTQPMRGSYNSANEKPAWQEPSQWETVTTQPMKNQPGKTPANERQLQLSQWKTSLARTQPMRDSYNSANEKPAWQEPSQWEAVTNQPMKNQPGKNPANERQLQFSQWKPSCFQTLNSSKGPFVYSSPANFLFSSLKELSMFLLGICMWLTLCKHWIAVFADPK